MLKKKKGGGNIFKKNKIKGSNIGSCPQVPVGFAHSFFNLTGTGGSAQALGYAL